jgi:hypothetical protein
LLLGELGLAEVAEVGQRQNARNHSRVVGLGMWFTHWLVVLGAPGRMWNTESLWHKEVAPWLSNSQEVTRENVPVEENTLEATMTHAFERY